MNTESKAQFQQEKLKGVNKPCIEKFRIWFLLVEIWYVEVLNSILINEISYISLSSSSSYSFLLGSYTSFTLENSQIIIFLKKL